MFSKSLKEVIKNNVALGAQFITSGVVALLLTPKAIESIGVESYGGIGYSLAIASYLVIFISYSAPLIGVRKVVQSQSMVDEITWFKVFTTAKLINLTGVIAIVLLVCLINGVDNNELWLIIVAASVAAAVNSTWLMQAKNKFTLISCIAIFGSLVALFLGFNSSLKPRNMSLAEWFAIALVSPQVVGGILSVIAALKSLKIDRWRIEIGFLRKVRGEWVNGMPLFGSQIISSIYTAGGPIAIFWILGKEDTGIFTGIDKFTSALMGALSLIGVASYPVLAKLFKTDVKKYKILLLEILSLYCAVSLIIAVTIAMFAEQILEYIFGNVTEASKLTLYLGCFWLQFGIAGPLVTNHLALNNCLHKILRLNIVIMMVALALSIMLIKIMGPAGWYLSISIAQIPLIIELANTLKKSSMRTT